jgi:dihydroorotate dehydrogenase
LYSHDKQGLGVNLFGLKFPNPVGLAAGYDKDGLGMTALACLGFGHIELGTVTPNPQLGNPRPRIFRLQEDQALINRMGFPNAGAAVLHRRLRRKKPTETVIGVNIGKGGDTPIEDAVQDYVGLLRMFYALADYIVINVSSPNTIGLRRLQARQHLDVLLAECALEREALQGEQGKRVPVLVKLAPDLSLGEIDDAVDVLLTQGIDGVIATNTTTAREELKSKFAQEIGGLSGAPLRRRSLEVVSHIHKVTSGKLPIIGVGGIFGADHAKEMLDSGASLVQIYTGLVYRGPGLVRGMLRELSS